MSSPAPVPIACTLSSDGLRNRMDTIARLNVRHLLSHERDDLCLSLTYRAAALDDLHELVRQESQCCAFLEMQLDTGVGDVVRLDIRAPDAVRGATAEVFAPFLAGTR